MPVEDVARLVGEGVPGHRDVARPDHGAEARYTRGVGAVDGPESVNVRWL